MTAGPASLGPSCTCKIGVTVYQAPLRCMPQLKQKVAQRYVAVSLKCHPKPNQDTVCNDLVSLKCHPKPSQDTVCNDLVSPKCHPKPNQDTVCNDLGPSHTP
eukprot:957574-Pelagomonas_calceolata.AAC.9